MCVLLPGLSHNYSMYGALEELGRWLLGEGGETAFWLEPWTSQWSPGSPMDGSQSPLNLSGVAFLPPASRLPLSSVGVSELFSGTWLEGSSPFETALYLFIYFLYYLYARVNGCFCFSKTPPSHF